MSDIHAISAFLRDHAATPVGLTPTLPTMPPDDGDEGGAEAVDLAVEMGPDEWEPRLVPEHPPAREHEFPVRFIDGCHAGQPVLCLRVRGRGWPIPLYLAEVGAVSLRLEGRRFVREFRVVERVLSFVADTFPWAQVEGFAAALWNDAGFRIRVLPANMPPPDRSPFDYEVMRGQARARAQREMRTLERLAIAFDSDAPTLVDGPLNPVTSAPAAGAPLLMGIVKVQAASHLHDQGWRTLLALQPSHRTPVFKLEGRRGVTGGLPVVTWFVKLAGGPRLAPNWGHVRVEIPWAQFLHRGGVGSGFVGRLSRWLIDARCRAASYARMPVSLEPVVRAEDALKPLFTPLPVLVNRLYRRAGVFRRDEP